MNIQPLKHLILINGHTHQGQWLEENSYLSFSDPYDLAEYWRNYFNNQILEVAQNLWKEYPRSLLTPRKTPKFEPLLYCEFCNKYAIYHEHDCDDYPPRDPYDFYPSDAPSTY